VRRAIHTLSATFAAVAAIGIVVLMGITVADVIRRALTDKSIQGGIELAPLILVGAVLLGLGYAEQTRTNVRTSLVTSRLAARPRAAVRCVGFVVVIGLVLWMVWETADRARSAVEIGEVTPGFVGLPAWPARVAIPIGLGVLALELLLQLLDELRVLAGREPVERTA